MRSFLTACSLFMIWLALVVKIENVSANLDYPWMYYLQYGNNVTLKPLFKNETEVILIKTCKWTSPKGIEIIPDVYNPDPNRYSINKYDCQLRITNIQADTNGIYHCNINDKYISKAMLNLHGAPGKTMAEELRPNIIAGLVTFFSKELFFLFKKIHTINISNNFGM